MEGVHLLYLGGALGGAIVRLYQNGGYDEFMFVRILSGYQLLTVYPAGNSPLSEKISQLLLERDLLHRFRKIKIFMFLKAISCIYYLPAV